MRSQIRNEPPLGKVVTEKGKASIFAFTWPPPPSPALVLKLSWDSRGQGEGETSKRKVFPRKAARLFLALSVFISPVRREAQPCAPARHVALWCCQGFSSKGIYLVIFLTDETGTRSSAFFSPSLLPCVRGAACGEAFLVQSLPRGDGRRGCPMAARRAARHRS